MNRERLAAIREVVNSLSRSRCRFVVHGSARFAHSSTRAPNDLDLVVAARDLARVVSVLLHHNADARGESWNEPIELSSLLTRGGAQGFCDTYKERFYLRLRLKDLQIDITYAGVVFKKWAPRLSPFSRPD